jgi:hypothetical protein
MRAGILAPRIRVVYCLTSSAGDLYEAMTLVSLGSLRRTNPTAHVTIVCDQGTHRALRAAGSALLDHADAVRYATTPAGSDLFRNRFLKTQLGRLIRGPFLFLDSDTVVRESLAPLLELSAEIAAAPNHSRDSFAEQMWSEDQANLELMGWQVQAPYLNAGVIWYGGGSASRRLAESWHRHWLANGRCTGRWRDQPAFNHAVSQAAGLRFEPLEHRWNAQYMTAPASATGASIWHVYGSTGTLDEREREWFFLTCQRLLDGTSGAEADPSLIEALVSHPTPYRD